MSETATAGDNSGTTATAEEFKPITSQADLDAVIGERLVRERNKYADYGDLQAKAAKLDEIEQANQTELEKATTRVTAAEQERDAAKSEAARLRVAVKHGISIEDADLFLTGSDEETLTKQAQRLLEREADRKKNGNVVPKEGTTSKPEADPVREFTRNLLKADS